MCRAYCFVLLLLRFDALEKKQTHRESITRQKFVLIWHKNKFFLSFKKENWIFNEKKNYSKEEKSERKKTRNKKNKWEKESKQE